MDAIANPALIFYGTMKLLLIALFSMSLNFAGETSTGNQMTGNNDQLVADVAAENRSIL
ncbi:MAG: hypothetical protein L3J32_11580 [Rhizobiaceae bacterium]|nr:hypothetical protein [Rhizobiaceae bacterium]